MADTKVIDTKITLSFLITTGILLIGFLASGIWAAATISNKLDQLLARTDKTDARNEARDSRVESLASSITDIHLTDAKQELRLDSVERAVGLKLPTRKQ